MKSEAAAATAVAQFEARTNAQTISDLRKAHASDKLEMWRNVARLERELAAVNRLLDENVLKVNDEWMTLRTAIERNQTTPLCLVCRKPECSGCKSTDPADREVFECR